MEKRDKSTLLPLIENCVQKGCENHSDGWKEYGCLKKEGYKHSIVNHSIEFKAEDGTCTNNIEGMWSLVKLKIKSMKGVLHDKISAILDEFTYRHRYGRPNGDIYYRFLADIAKQKRRGGGL